MTGAIITDWDHIHFIEDITVIIVGVRTVGSFKFVAESTITTTLEEESIVRLVVRIARLVGHIATTLVQVYIALVVNNG